MGDQSFLRQVSEQIITERRVEDVRRPLASPDDLKRALALDIGDDVTDDKELVEMCNQTLINCAKPGGAALASYPQPPAVRGMAGGWTGHTLNTNHHTFEAAPVFVMMERELIRQVAALVGYGEYDGLFCPDHSISYQYALSIARYKHFPNVAEEGVSSLPRMAIFSSENVDCSFEKNISFLGMGSKALNNLSRDPCGRMKSRDLEDKIIAAKADGRHPLLVCASAGSSVSGAIDPLSEIADVCQRHQVWLHVDASLGGALLFTDKHKHLLSNIHRADSLTWSSDALLGTARDCTLFLTRHLNLLRDSLESKARYLFLLDKIYDVSYDVGEKSIQCGRTTDVIKIWLLWKSQGSKGLGEHINTVMDIASSTRDKMNNAEGFRLVFDEPLSPVICFWYVPSSMRKSEGGTTGSEQLSQVSMAIHRQISRDGHVTVDIEGATGMPCYLKVTVHSDAITPNHVTKLMETCANIGENI